MSKLYIDTSCLPPYFTAESASVRAKIFFEAERADVFCISPWTCAEFHSAIARKVRIGLLPAAVQTTVLRAFDELTRHYFECWPVQTEDFSEAARLCNPPKLNLRSSDALHLAIARREQAVLVSLDSALLDAAHHYKIPTQTF